MVLSSTFIWIGFVLFSEVLHPSIFNLWMSAQMTEFRMAYTCMTKGSKFYCRPFIKCDPTPHPQNIYYFMKSEGVNSIYQIWTPIKWYLFFKVSIQNEEWWKLQVIISTLYKMVVRRLTLIKCLNFICYHFGHGWSRYLHIEPFFFL